MERMRVAFDALKAIHEGNGESAALAKLDMNEILRDIGVECFY